MLKKFRIGFWAKVLLVPHGFWHGALSGSNLLEKMNAFVKCFKYIIRSNKLVNLNVKYSNHSYHKTKSFLVRWLCCQLIGIAINSLLARRSLPLFGVAYPKCNLSRSYACSLSQRLLLLDL